MANINTKEYWDERWNKHPMFSRKLEKVIMNLVEPNTVVIDFGCGSGRILRGLRKDKNCEVMGSDISQVAIDKLQRWGISGEVMDLEKSMLYSKICDISILSHTLEHITNDELVIEELANATRKYTIIAVPNDCMEDEPEHVRKYTKESLSKLVLKYFSSIEDHSVGVHLILKCFV